MNPKDLLDFDNRVVIITGANGGFGRKMVATFLGLGANVIATDRPDSEWPSMFRESPQEKLEILESNLEDETHRKEFICKVKDKHKELHVLVNNAAFVGSTNLTGWVSSFESQSLDTWRRALEVNLTASFHLCRDLSSSLARSKRGSIIQISSIYGGLGPIHKMYEGTKMGNPAAYASSKAGVTQLSRWLSTTLAPAVRVNTLSLGGVYSNQPSEFVSRYEERTPMGRMANYSDFVGAILFLASDMSLYMTGQEIIVDGGWSAW